MKNEINKTPKGKKIFISRYEIKSETKHFKDEEYIGVTYDLFDGRSINTLKDNVVLILK